MQQLMITANFKKYFEANSGQIVSIFHSFLFIISHFIFRNFKQNTYYSCNE